MTVGLTLHNKEQTTLYLQARYVGVISFPVYLITCKSKQNAIALTERLHEMKDGLRQKHLNPSARCLFRFELSHLKRRSVG